MSGNRRMRFARKRSNRGSIEVSMAFTEGEALSTAEAINAKTRRHNSEVRAERRKAADKAKIKLPTFNLPDDD